MLLLLLWVVASSPLLLHPAAPSNLLHRTKLAAVLRGMEVVYSIEKKGSSTGKLSSSVKIVDAGELPLLRHSRPGGAAGNASAAAEAEQLAEAAAEEALD
jgi:hypothetical protein